MKFTHTIELTLINAAGVSAVVCKQNLMFKSEAPCLAAYETLKAAHADCGKNRSPATLEIADALGRLTLNVEQISNVRLLDQATLDEWANDCASANGRQEAAHDAAKAAAA